MIKNKNFIGLLLSSTLVLGCSFDGVIPLKKEHFYEIKASEKKGAELNFNIKINSSKFTTKANEIGTVGKFFYEIDHFLVYLIKNSTSPIYPSGGDPLGDTILGPITIPVGSSEQIKITGLDDSFGDTYYIAVRAQDSSNNDLIKNNNGSSTPWTGTTASTTLKIAVSDFGAVVNSSLVITPKNNLVVTINLTDEIGNTLGVNTSVNNGAILRYDSRVLDNYIVTLAGNGLSGFLGDGSSATFSTTRLKAPEGVILDSSGNMYISDTGNHRIRKVDTSGIINTIVGSSSTAGFSGEGVQATSALLSSPSGIAIDQSNNIYFCDSGNHRIRKVDTSGVITTIAGSSSVGGFSGDGGQATSAKLNVPYSLFLDGVGNIYFSDSFNNRIRKIDTSGIITTIAGVNTGGFSGDGGMATNAELNSPRGLFLDSFGNLYLSDSLNHRIRKIDQSGIITTIAGSGVAISDGGPATNAKLANPEGVVLDKVGNIYISDRNNHRIRKIDNSGTITTIAGTGTPGFLGNETLSSDARLSSPALIHVDNFGNVYIADKSNNRIRKIYAN